MGQNASEAKLTAAVAQSLGMASQVVNINEPTYYERQFPSFVSFCSDDRGLKSYIYQEVVRSVVDVNREYILHFRNGYVADIGLVYDSNKEIIPFSLANHGGVSSFDEVLKYNARDVGYVPGKSLFVFKSGKSNYGHIIVEMLPKIENYLKYSDEKIRIIIPSMPAPMRLAIAGFIKMVYGDQLEIFYLQDALTQFEELIVPSPVSTHNTQKSPTLQKFIDRTLRRVGVDESEKKKIYVSRQNISKRRMLNDAVVEAYFEQYGFTILSPESLSIPEQVQVFANASHIIGPLGAGMTNVMYSGPGVKVSIIDPGMYDFFFYDLSSLLKQDFIWTFCQKVERMTVDSVSRDYVVPENLLPVMAAAIL